MFYQTLVLTSLLRYQFVLLLPLRDLCLLHEQLKNLPHCSQKLFLVLQLWGISSSLFSKVFPCVTIVGDISAIKVFPCVTIGGDISAIKCVHEY